VTTTIRNEAIVSGTGNTSTYLRHYQLVKELGNSSHSEAQSGILSDVFHDEIPNDHFQGVHWCLEVWGNDVVAADEFGVFDRGAEQGWSRSFDQARMWDSVSRYKFAWELVQVEHVVK